VLPSLTTLTPLRAILGEVAFCFTQMKGDPMKTGRARRFSDSARTLHGADLVQ
jgi:hypothetical protein